MEICEYVHILVEIAKYIYINTLCRCMYICPKNTINIYSWTVYTPINDLLCYALNPFDIFKSLSLYMYLDSTLLDVHILVLQSILRSTTMCHVYNQAGWQIFESALKERYAYVQ